MEALQASEGAIIIGGAAYILYKFRHLLWGLDDAADDAAKIAKDALDIYKGAWEATPVIIDAGKAAGALAFGSKEDADKAGKEFMNELRREKEEGNPFINAVDAVDKLTGGAGITDPVYFELKGFEIPLMGAFGDQTDNKLFKMRCWYGATLRHDRQSVTSWNVLLQRENKGHVSALTPKLTGWQRSVEKQLDDITQAYTNYTRSDTTPFVKYNGKRQPGDGRINERFTQPSSDLYNNDGFARAYWLQLDDDASSYLRVYISGTREELEASGTKIAGEDDPSERFAVDSGDKMHIGLAGALDDLFPDWREKWKKDKETARIDMCDTLNHLDIPSSYFDLNDAKIKNNSEYLFITHYGIGRDILDGAYHFKPSLNTVTQEETIEHTSRAVVNTLKKIHF
jgi:hypothetical protein